MAHRGRPLILQGARLKRERERERQRERESRGDILCFKWWKTWVWTAYRASFWSETPPHIFIPRSTILVRLLQNIELPRTLSLRSKTQFPDSFHCVNVSRTLLTHTFTSTCKFPPPHLETTNYTLQRTHNLHYLNIYLQIRPERSPLSSYHITIFAALFLCSKIAHTFLSFLLSVVVVHSIQDWAPFWLQTNFNLQITPSQPSQSSWFFSPASLKQTKLFREKILALFNKTTKFGWSLYGTRTEFGSGGIDKNDHQE